MRCPYCNRGELRSSSNTLLLTCDYCSRQYEMVAGQLEWRARTRSPRGYFTRGYFDEIQDVPAPENPYDNALPDAPDVPEGELMLDTLTLPAGWQWNGGDPPSTGAQFAYVNLSPQHVAYSGTPQAGQASYTERIAALVALCSQHNVRLIVNRNDQVEISGDGWGPLSVAVPTQFLVCVERYFTYNHGGHDWSQAEARKGTCSDCGERHTPGAFVCPTTGYPTYCATCGRHTGGGVGYDAGHAAWYCPSCQYDCQECGGACPSGYDYCSACRRHETCRICRADAWLEDGDPSIVNSDSICEACIERQCPECGRYSPHALQWSPTQERMLCRSCWRGSLTDVLEHDDDHDDDTAEIPSIPGREKIRMCGIELEGGNGTGNGSQLARELYRAGLSRYNDVQGYHHGAGSFMHVENDSSVDWELVIGPLNPADSEQMKAVNTALRIVRRGIKAKQYKLDLRCGLHVHVGAEGFGLGKAFNLNTLFSYVEDVMFRLAAAKWPMHRSMTGSPYCQPVAKSTSKLAFGREVGQNEERDARRVALNFRNYFQRMLNNCRCGAVRFDSWEDCTCDLGKCTFEFRLFNSTANPRKLHAYLALAQALVAKAGELPEITNPEQDYPPQTFIGKPFKGMTDDEKVQALADWLPRLRWILTELPLTDDERQSVLYCVHNSDLNALGDQLDEFGYVNDTEEVTA